MNLNRLDLNLLVALDVLLAERSITHAAERLNLSPSATSGALARLRTYFDDELLTQIGRRMTPTPLGESLQAAGCRVVSGGTDSHLILVDVFSKGVRGKEAEKALDEAYITVNKNAIPFDQNPPLNPSGVRLGSPAVTTRGFRESEMREVGGLIAEVLANISSEDTLASVRRRVGTLAERHPLYGWKLARATA